MQNKHHDSALSFKIILLGDANVGKTCFIKQYIDHRFVQNQKVTCNVDFVLKTCQVDEFRVKLNIFDTAGQERFRSLTKSYFKGADAVLFMYEMSNKDSFINLREWVQFYQKQSESMEEIRVLVGTKKDLWRNANSQMGQNLQKEFVSSQEIKNFIQKHKFLFKFQTSAKQNVNIDAVFEQITRNLIFDTLQKKRNTNQIKIQEWDGILKRDKLHLMKQNDKNGQCC